MKQHFEPKAESELRRMNYKSFNLGDWIGHISGVIEDETTLDGNEMRDLVEFLSTLKQEHCEDCVSRAEVIDELNRLGRNAFKDDTDYDNFFAFLDSLLSVKPVACIAKVSFSKEDMRELVNEKMKEIVVERKKGKWIEDYIPLPLSDGSKKCYQCSECRTHWDNVFNYCPNCGSFMMKED